MPPTNPLANPSASPLASPCTSLLASPLASPLANPSAHPSASPLASPSASPSGSFDFAVGGHFPLVTFCCIQLPLLHKPRQQWFPWFMCAWLMALVAAASEPLSSSVFQCLVDGLPPKALEAAVASKDLLYTGTLVGQTESGGRIIGAMWPGHPGAKPKHKSWEAGSAWSHVFV